MEDYLIKGVPKEDIKEHLLKCVHAEHTLDQCSHCDKLFLKKIDLVYKYYRLRYSNVIKRFHKLVLLNHI